MTRRGVYIAVDEDGNVYGGQSTDLNRRANQHSHHGRTVIAKYDVPSVDITKTEKSLIGFLCNQSREEDFDCTNKICRGGK